ncbi:MAG TPA: 6-phosphofructokinase [Firmicutes bacterium]|nr:6-phosphofructokinase [Bacillota bacterium]
MATCIVAQAGGPTAVINSTLYGIIDEAKRVGIQRILGARGGIRGVIEEDFVELGTLDPSTLSLIRTTPGAILGGCRHRLSDSGAGVLEFQRIMRVLDRHDISFFFYIGGNDSMDTALKIQNACQANGLDISVIGIPKTVDNDICHTDHCPGYGSAAKFIATAVIEAGLHARSMFADEKVVILETVGRNTGWLAASSALARRRTDDPPHLVYLPEVDFSEDKFLGDIDECVSTLGGAFVVVAEGIRTRDGRLLGAVDEGRMSDPFGHPQLGEAASHLSRLVRTHLGLSVRYVKLDICQQSAIHLASRTDWEEAAIVGRRAVDYAIAGKSGVMVSLERAEGEGPAKTGCVPLVHVANVERRIPLEWIDSSGTFVTDQFISYLSPLILGEVPIPMEGGLPVYAKML